MCRVGRCPSRDFCTFASVIPGSAVSSAPTATMLSSFLLPSSSSISLQGIKITLMSSRFPLRSIMIWLTINFPPDARLPAHISNNGRFKAIARRILDQRRADLLVRNDNGVVGRAAAHFGLVGRNPGHFLACIHCRIRDNLLGEQNALPTKTSDDNFFLYFAPSEQRLERRELENRT